MIGNLKIKVMKPVYVKNAIRFKTNWNNKLYANAFTTIRLAPREIGSILVITPTRAIGVEPFEVEVLSCRDFFLSQLTETMAWLDTGYDRKKTIEIMQEMYEKKYPDWATRRYFYMLLRRTVRITEGKLKGDTLW